MKDNSKFAAIILVIITILVVVLTNIFSKEEEQKENKIEVVTNYSNFYTVDSCLYRTITYIATKDNQSLLSVISSNYKKENSIDANNVLNVFSEVEEDSTFVSRKMYYEKINNSITKYYVYGHIEKNQIMDDEIIIKHEYKEQYFIVYLDFTNKTFAIEPYNGELFIGGENNE